MNARRSPDRSPLTPATKDAPISPGRVLVYTDDRYGLGHIRRALAIVEALSRRLPEAALLVLTGSAQAHAFAMPENADWIKLPAVDRGAVYAGLPAKAVGGFQFRGPEALREGLIYQTALAFAPRIVVVDLAPAGYRNELRRTLARRRAARPRVTLILCLYDNLDRPGDVRSVWRHLRIYDLLDHTYDHILVGGSRGIFDVGAEYGFSARALAKTSYIGYLLPQSPALPADDVRARLGIGSKPFVVATVGGGADGAPVLDAYLAAARLPALAGVASLVVTGPFLGAEHRTALERAAADRPDVSLLPFTDDLPSYLAAADAVVTMAGVNAIAETVGRGKRTIVVPRVRPWQEQLIRAERLARHGLVTMLHPDDLTPRRLAEAVRDSLAAPTPAVCVDAEGLRRLCDIVEGAISPG